MTNVRRENRFRVCASSRGDHSDTVRAKAMAVRSTQWSMVLMVGALAVALLSPAQPTLAAGYGYGPGPGFGPGPGSDYWPGPAYGPDYGFGPRYGYGRGYGFGPRYGHRRGPGYRSGPRYRYRPGYRYRYSPALAGDPLYVPWTTASAAKETAPSAKAAQTEAKAEAGAPAAEVRITAMQFSPASITVKAGDIVTWRQEDAVPHQIRSRDGRVASDRLKRGQSFSKSFDEPGRYEYYCSLHPSMKGTVIVE